MKHDENQVKEWKKELDGMQKKLRSTDQDVRKLKSSLLGRMTKSTYDPEVTASSVKEDPRYQSEYSNKLGRLGGNQVSVDQSYQTRESVYEEADPDLEDDYGRASMANEVVKKKPVSKNGKTKKTLK